MNAELLNDMAIGTLRGVMAGPTAIATGLRNELAAVAEHTDTPESSNRNFGNILIGCTGIAFATSAGLAAAVDGYYMLPETALKTMVLTNTASFALEVGKCIYSKVQRRSSNI